MRGHQLGLRRNKTIHQRKIRRVSPVPISDAGPLIHLGQIDKLNLLQKLFGNVLITPKVKREVLDEGTRLLYADAKLANEALKDGWLKIQTVPKQLETSSRKLAQGENISTADGETLILAKHLKTDLLVDDKAVSDLARIYGLKQWSTWTILLESQSKNLIETSDIEVALDELGKKKFRLTPNQAAEILNASKIISQKTNPKTRKTT